MASLTLSPGRLSSLPGSRRCTPPPQLSQPELDLVEDDILPLSETSLFATMGKVLYLLRVSQPQYEDDDVPYFADEKANRERQRSGTDFAMEEDLLVSPEAAGGSTSRPTSPPPQGSQASQSSSRTGSPRPVISQRRVKLDLNSSLIGKTVKSGKADGVRLPTSQSLEHLLRSTAFDAASKSHVATVFALLRACAAHWVIARREQKSCTTPKSLKRGGTRQRTPAPSNTSGQFDNPAVPWNDTSTTPDGTTEKHSRDTPETPRGSSGLNTVGVFPLSPAVFTPVRSASTEDISARCRLRFRDLLDSLIVHGNTSESILETLAHRDNLEPVVSTLVLALRAQEDVDDHRRRQALSEQTPLSAFLARKNRSDVENPPECRSPGKGTKRGRGGAEATVSTGGSSSNAARKRPRDENEVALNEKSSDKRSVEGASKGGKLRKAGGRAATTPPPAPAVAGTRPPPSHTVTHFRCFEEEQRVISNTISSCLGDAEHTVEDLQLIGHIKTLHALQFILDVVLPPAVCSDRYCGLHAHLNSSKHKFLKRFVAAGASRTNHIMLAIVASRNLHSVTMLCQWGMYTMEDRLLSSLFTLLLNSGVGELIAENIASGERVLGLEAVRYFTDPVSFDGGTTTVYPADLWWSIDRDGLLNVVRILVTVLADMGAPPLEPKTVKAEDEDGEPAKTKLELGRPPSLEPTQSIASTAACTTTSSSGSVVAAVPQHIAVPIASSLCAVAARGPRQLCAVVSAIDLRFGTAPLAFLPTLSIMVKENMFVSGGPLDALEGWLPTIRWQLSAVSSLQSSRIQLMNILSFCTSLGLSTCRPKGTRDLLEAAIEAADQVLDRQGRRRHQNIVTASCHNAKVVLTEILGLTVDQSGGRSPGRASSPRNRRRLRDALSWLFGKS